MSTLKFKTNIKCSGCVDAVTPHLNATQGINQWKVDLSTPEKILIVETNGASKAQVIAAMREAGYTAEII